MERSSALAICAVALLLVLSGCFQFSAGQAGWTSWLAEFLRSAGWLILALKFPVWGRWLWKLRRAEPPAPSADATAAAAAVPPLCGGASCAAGLPPSLSGVDFCIGAAGAPATFKKTRRAGKGGIRAPRPPLRICCPIPPEQALLHAAAIGDTAKVQALLQRGLCPTAAISKDKPTLDWTAVHFAAANGHGACLELLLGAKAAADTDNAAGATPLQLAVRHMHLDAVQALLAAGVRVKEADIKAALESGHAEVLAALAAAPGREAAAALAEAAERKNLAAVQLLLRAGVKPAGTGAIVTAAWEQSLEVVEALLAGGSPVDDLIEEGDGSTALMAAAANDDIPMMRVLLAAGANPQAQWEEDEMHTPLEMVHIAEAARVLIEAGAELQNAAFGYLPLHTLIDNGRLEPALVLLEAGALPNLYNQEGHTALHLAAQLGSLGEPLFLPLLAAGANVHAFSIGPDDPGDTALHYAADADVVSPGCIKLLLEAGANVGATGYAGATPLHLVAPSNSDTAAEAVAALLAAGAPVWRADDRGRTPLHEAAHGGSAEHVRLLLAAGSDPCTADRTGRTPLMEAASWGSDPSQRGEVARRLLEGGAAAAAAAADLAGRTALLEAARMGLAEVVRLLVAAGSEAIGAPDSSGRTPLYEAVTARHLDGGRPGAPAIVATLAAAGAPLDAPGPDGETPLLAALRLGHQACAEALLRAGARPSAEAVEHALRGVRAAKLAGGDWLRRLLPSQCVSSSQLQLWCSAAFPSGLAAQREMLRGVWTLQGSLPPDVLRLLAAMCCIVA